MPVASEKVTDEIAAIIDEVSAAMSPEDLVELNSQSVNEQRSADDIAAEWLEAEGLL
ncbi:MAG TPA: glycine betaine ABC transporter substrate-binding protein [Agromyces sp.]